MGDLILNFEHPQWTEFISRLEGEEGSAFRGELPGDVSFLCMSPGPFSHALTVSTVSILMRMNRDKSEDQIINIPATVEWLMNQRRSLRVRSTVQRHFAKRKRANRK